jgi:membrane associated rhomboid family serine protease
MVYAQLAAVRVVSMEPAVLAGSCASNALESGQPLNHRQPIFNVPGVVVALLGSFLAVHLVRWALPSEDGAWLTAALAFIPARETGLAEDLPGGRIAMATSFLTHQFVHGDLAHLLINSAWLLAFGTPVARRTDVARFVFFFLLAGVAGALLYLAVNGGALILVIGASGAISGLMGAAFRFLFIGMADGGPMRLTRASSTPLMSLADTLQDRRILMAIAGWTVLNFVLAWGAAGLTEAAGIAWEAHLGGFYAGLLLYGFFDRPPVVKDDAAGAE